MYESQKSVRPVQSPTCHGLPLFTPGPTSSIRPPDMIRTSKSMTYSGFRSYGSITSMSEVVGTFLSAEQRNERANRPEETRNSPRGDFAQQRFEFAVRQFDRVEVRRILRQIAKRCPSTFNCLLDASNFVRWKVVHHHDIAAPERRNQALFHVGQEHFSIHGAVDHHGRRHFIVT